MKPAPDLRELRLLASRYGVPLEVVDRLTLRPHEIARATGFSRLTVRKWINSGELEVIEAPGGLAITVVDLLRFLEQRKVVRKPSGDKPLADRAESVIDRPRGARRAGVES